jgi:ribosomal protein S18 acetylase RimI-like enzyme
MSPPTRHRPLLCDLERAVDAEGVRRLIDATIRPASIRDIPEMHRIRSSVHENRLTDPVLVQPYQYEQLLRAGRGWVCEVHGRIVGFSMADVHNASVWALFVDPACERQGIGRRLHDAMVESLFESGLERITLTTDPDTRSDRSYRAAGWRAVGTEPNGEVRFVLDRRPAGRS